MCVCGYEVIGQSGGHCIATSSLRSLYGRLYLRDFNELDHELSLRCVQCRAGWNHA